jgi:AcrR family transcriptional regulator
VSVREHGSAGSGSATRELVRSASTELFAQRGFAATTMRQLADHAELPLSAFYYYFKSKYDVLLAIMDAAMSNLEDGLEEAVASTIAADRRLTTLVGRHVEVHLLDPGIARVADGELRSLRPEDRQAIVDRRDSYEEHFRDALSAGVDQGIFDPHLDTPLASMAILTMATGVIDWWRPGGRYSIQETADLIGAFALSLARGGSSGGVVHRGD